MTILVHPGESTNKPNFEETDIIYLSVLVRIHVDSATSRSVLHKLDHWTLEPFSSLL